MRCSDSMMKYTGYLHILSIIIAIFGTSKQVDAIKSGDSHSLWLTMSLAVFLLLKIPNQICVATRESHGWFSVFGTLMGVFGFLYISYVSYEYNKKNKKD